MGNYLFAVIPCKAEVHVHPEDAEIGIVCEYGFIMHHYSRRLFLKWQLRELKRMAGILSSEEGFYGTPGK